jgi:DNA-binding NtrC family response regulator
MPVHLQSKLLRVLQERTVERLGGTQPRPVDVRVISATHRNLRQMVDEALFREDLYYRLAVFPVELPPLRDREGDIALLSHHFLRKYAHEEGKPLTGISAPALRVLESYDFPGNVRELENAISHAVVVASGKAGGGRAVHQRGVAAHAGGAGARVDPARGAAVRRQPGGGGAAARPVAGHDLPPAGEDGRQGPAAGLERVEGFRWNVSPVAPAAAVSSTDGCLGAASLRLCVFARH